MSTFSPSATAPPLSPTLAVIVPVYNVGSLFGPVLDALLEQTSNVIVVDDGCTDGSLDGVTGRIPTLIRHDLNRGKGHALMSGFREALAHPANDAVAVLDADGQHDPAELPGLWAAHLEHAADLTIGSRAFGGGGVPWRSRFGNELTVRMMHAVLGVRLPDTQSGYRILSRAFAEAVVETVPGGRYETEMAMVGLAIRGGYTIVSEPIQTIYVAGNASSHFRKIRDSYRIYRTLFRTARGRRT